MLSSLQQAGKFLACFFLFASGCVLLALVGLTVVEVFSRYILNAPINGKQDIAKLMLASCIFLAFPIITLRRAHIDVDLLDGFFAHRLRHYRDCLIDLLVSGALLSLCWWLWEKSAKFQARGAVTEALYIPIYPFTYAIAFIVGVSGLLLLLWAGYRLVSGHRLKEQ